MSVCKMGLEAFIAMLMLAIPAYANPAHPPPPNTIDCKDWRHNTDGTWTARPNAKPFDLGPLKGITVLSSTTVRYGMNFERYDLASVLDEICGKTQSKSVD